jgi:hypothetical protein
MSSTNNELNENSAFAKATADKAAEMIFGLLPEQGPVMVIMDNLGNCRPSDIERFQQLNIDESLLRELCEKIDDGSEPVLTQVDGASIVAAQLSTEYADCGYVFIILPQYSPESTLANIDLIEILLSQAGLIARLIETNEHLHELQAKQWDIYRHCEVSTS